MPADAAIEPLRLLVALGGPVVALSSLHARLDGYLHDRSRQALLVLPLSPLVHFSAAHRRHVQGLALTTLVGISVLAISVASRPFLVAVNLLLDYIALLIALWLFEPMIAAIGAFAGRRFPTDSLVRSLQTGLGGGWTLPEAVVHLYGPALGIGVAMGIALPWQLAIDMAVDDLPYASFMGPSLATLVVAIGCRVAAPWVYRLGIFQAVPFLAEASKTLAGPPIPDPAPRWVETLRDPLTRLVVLQLMRLTPLPQLRLLLLLGVTLLAVWRPSMAMLGVVVASSLLWLIPAGAVFRQRDARRRLISVLPLQHHRDPPVFVWMLLLAPIAIAWTASAGAWWRL